MAVLVDGLVAVTVGCTVTVVVFSGATVVPCVTVAPERWTVVVLTVGERVITVCVSLVSALCTSTAARAPSTSTTAAARIHGPAWPPCSGAGAPAGGYPGGAGSRGGSCGGCVDTCRKIDRVSSPGFARSG